MWKQVNIVFLFCILGIGAMAGLALNRPEIYKASQTIKPEPFHLDHSGTQPAENSIALTLASQSFEKEGVTTLKDLIERKNLFEEERASGKTSEMLANKIMTGIEVDNVSMSEGAVNSFDLSFISPSRENAEAVTSALFELIRSPSNADQRNKIVVLTSCCPRTRAVAPKRGFMMVFGAFAGSFVGITIVLVRRKRRLP